MKEAIAGLLYAASRCGEFPELQEIRAVFTSHYGKEFTARAVELRNNCGVSPTVITKYCFYSHLVIVTYVVIFFLNAVDTEVVDENA